jgi:hypothetical protein
VGTGRDGLSLFYFLKNFSIENRQYALQGYKIALLHEITVRILSQTAILISFIEALA